MNDGPYLNNNVHSDWSTILQIEIQNVIWQHDIQQRWSAQWGISKVRFQFLHTLQIYFTALEYSVGAA